MLLMQESGFPQGTDPVFCSRYKICDIVVWISIFCVSSSIQVEKSCYTSGVFSPQINRFFLVRFVNIYMKYFTNSFAIITTPSLSHFSCFASPSHLYLATTQSHFTTKSLLVYFIDVSQSSPRQTRQRLQYNLTNLIKLEIFVICNVSYLEDYTTSFFTYFHGFSVIVRLSTG